MRRKVQVEKRTVALLEPTPTPTETPAPTPTPVYQARDLSVAELRESFETFQVVKSGFDPDSRVRMFGMIFRDCRDKFEFHNPTTQPGLRTNQYAGFRVTDKGGGTECMAAHRSARHSCSASKESEFYCIPFSEITETSLSLKNQGDVRVCLVTTQANRDPNAPADDSQCADFDPSAPITHLSADTIRLMRLRDQEARRANEIANLRSTIASCRNSPDEIIQARSALGRLVGYRALAEGEFDRISRELKRAELNIMLDHAKHAPLDKMATIREELLAEAAARPENADQIAGALYWIARRYVNDQNVNSESYELASSTIADAQTIEGLNGTAQSRLAGYQREIAIGRVSSLAQQGMQGNYMFWPSYSSLMQKLQRDAQRACTGRGAQMESCASAMTSIGQATQLPNQANQVDQQRAAFQQQMQAQMNAAMNPQMSQQQPVAFNGMPNTGSMPNLVPGMTNPAFPNATPMPSFNTLGATGIYGSTPGMAGGMPPVGSPIMGTPFRAI